MNTKSQEERRISNWIGWILLLVVVGGLVQLRFDNSVERTVNTKGVAYRQLQATRNQFAFNEEAIVVVYEAENIFAEAIIKKVADCQQQLEAVDGVLRVRSVLSERRIVASDQFFDYGPLVPAVGSYSQADEADARQSAIGTEALTGVLYNKELTTGALIVEFSSQIDGLSEKNRMVRSSRKIAHTSLNGLHPFLVGTPVVAYDLTLMVIRDFAVLLCSTLLVCFLLLWLKTGDIATSTLLLAPGLVSTACVLSIMGWAGTTLCAVTALLPPIVIAVGTSYSLHTFEGVIARGGMSWHTVRSPVLLSAVTTAVGLLSLFFIPVPVIRELSLFSAAAVIFAAVSTLWISQRFSSHLVQNTTVAARLNEQVSIGLARWAMSRPRTTIAAWVGITVLLAVAALHLDVDMDNIRMLKPTTSLRMRMEQVGENLAGSVIYQAVIERENGALMGNTVDLSRLRELTRLLEASPNIGKAVSIMTYYDAAAGAYAEGTTCDTIEQAEQLDLLFSMLGEDDPTRIYFSPDRNKALIVIYSQLTSSKALRALNQEYKEKIAALFPDCNGYITGGMAVFNETADLIAHFQRRGLLAACLLTSIIILFGLRSWKLGLLSIVPNAPPVLGVFAASWFLNDPLNFGNALVACIALGVVVDDTVHLLNAFRSKDKSSGLTVQDVVSKKAPAILWTSVVLGCSFAVFNLSHYQVLKSFGTFMIVAVALAAVGDLLVVPAVLMLLTSGKAKRD